MKKLLFVSHTLDFAAGGAERVLVDVVTRIDRDRFEISLATGGRDEIVPDELQSLEIPIHQLPHLPMFASANLWALLRVAIAVVVCQVSMWMLLRGKRFDVLHVNSIFALHYSALPCLLTGTPLIFHEHGLPRAREGSFWSFAYRWLVRRATHTIAITNAVRNQVLGFGLNPESITTVHNGIDPDDPALKQETPESTMSVRPGFRIVQISNFLDWKGHDIVLEALAKLRKSMPDARVVF
jgi:glycosyltransferase involved in cell wall biosynthesis